MSPEESFVRALYAKLSYAAELRVLAEAAIFDGKRFPDSKGPSRNDTAGLERELAAQPRFEITDVHVGPLTDFKEARIRDLITVPSTDALNVVADGTNFNVSSPFSQAETRVSWVTVLWKPTADIAREDAEVSSQLGDTPFASFIAKMPVHFSHYASFSVRLRFRGRTVPYRAMFLFPEKIDERGSGVWPLDLVVGPKLATLDQMALYPSAFLETGLRELPTVQAWIDAHRLSCANGKARTVCCDPALGLCGISPQDLQKSMAIEVDPATRELFKSGGRQ
jgi:hypothetical protein